MRRRRPADGDKGVRREAEAEEEAQERPAQENRAEAVRRREGEEEARSRSREGEQGQGGRVERLTPLAGARRMLHELHARADGVMVGLSGGKDSLVTLDLCIDEFGSEHVKPFFMY